MSHAGFIVPPRKKDDIIKAATDIRACFSKLITDQGRLPIDVVYELLPDLLPGFVLEVCEESEMGSDHGRAYPNQNLIKLRKDVYDGLCRGQGRDRFTGAHELGHLFLHRNVHFARAMTTTTKIYCDSEWQANTFASALLIDDLNLQRCRSVTEVAQRFGVSLQAAQVRYKK